MKIERALISVFDKTGVVELAKGLQKHGVEIISSGGTAKVLKKAKVKVVDVSKYTGFPEIMDGRVKTLHPAIYGGLLAVRDSKKHVNEAKKNKIKMIDLVVCNLYPFKKTAAKKTAKKKEVIEQIDIGGPSLMRAAAKNHEYVTVLADPADYKKVLEELKENEDTTPATKEYLAWKAFERVRAYDSAIESYFRKLTDAPEVFELRYDKAFDLRYGENPHQKAWFFRSPVNTDPNVTNSKQLSGKQVSFNNLLDADSALELVKEFKKPTCAVIKHNNPCGVASSKTIEKAFVLAHRVDPVSAFGCVIACNKPVNMKIVDYIKKNKLFIELIIAPKFEPKALEQLMNKKNLRLLETGPLKLDTQRIDVKKVAGGVLVQEKDMYQLSEKDMKVVTKKKPSKEQIRAMIFATKVVKHVRSNSVVFAAVPRKGSDDDTVTGIGAGQMSRVDSTWIAAKKAGRKALGSVMSSDAFFPFPDAVEEAAKAGVCAIVQPGGSIRDEEVFKKADELKLAMVITGHRFFKH
ncbi:MAG: bifunctional phosphoribosylaminoimidazolecarboxamide formyltransferase/IMP cyclohydrolase [Patescibacteria group bacterium]|nr:bifunctional phosphoribosylaminoimidazolecarboxamide formyltransferase/IMP cyclohydrolase [Patescibacteria group bacterium]